MVGKIKNYDLASKFIEREGAIFVARHVPGAPKFTMCALVQAGGYNDGGCGTAHFVEHLCMGHTKRFPNNEAEKFLKKCGGSCNALTSLDNTKYYCGVLRGHERDAISVISNIVCHPRWTEGDVQRQIDIIISECAEDAMDANNALYRKISSAAYENESGERSVTGTLETLSKMNLDKVVGFYEREYCADRLIVVMEGDFDVDSVLKTTAEAFDLPRGPPAVEIPEIAFTPSTKIYKSEEWATRAAIVIPSFTSTASAKEQVEMHLFHKMLFDNIGYVSGDLRGAKSLVYSIGVKASAHEKDRGFDAIIFDGLPERIPVIAKAFCESVNGFMENPNAKLFRMLTQNYIIDKRENIRREPEIEAKRMAQRISDRGIIYPRNIFIKTADGLALDEVIECGRKYLRNKGLSVCYMGQYRDNFPNHEEIMHMLRYDISPPTRSTSRNWKWLNEEPGLGEF